MVSIVHLNVLHRCDSHPFVCHVTLSRRSSRLFSDDKRVSHLAELAPSSTMPFLSTITLAHELLIPRARTTYSLFLSFARQIAGKRCELRRQEKRWLENRKRYFNDLDNEKRNWYFSCQLVRKIKVENCRKLYRILLMYQYHILIIS